MNEMESPFLSVIVPYFFQFVDSFLQIFEKNITNLLSQQIFCHLTLEQTNTVNAGWNLKGFWQKIKDLFPGDGAPDGPGAPQPVPEGMK